LKVIFITQGVDSSHPVIGFITSWIKELAKKVEYVHVLALKKGNLCDLPINISIYSFKRKNKLLSFLAFNKILFKIIKSENSIEVIFSHMCPIYAILAYPYAKLYRIRQVLWYAHRKVGFLLKIATLLVDVITTSSKESFRINSKKVKILSQGIDVSKIEKVDIKNLWHFKVKRILSVGRITPIKDYKTLIKAAAIINSKNCLFQIIGKPVTKRDYEYLKELKDMIEDYNLRERVEIIEGVSYNEIFRFYRDSFLLVNLCPQGAPDKAVFEAMASCLLILVCNKVFEEMLKGVVSYDFLFKEKDPQDLAKKIKYLLSLKEDISILNRRNLRDFAIKNHSIEGLMSNLIGLLFLQKINLEKDMILYYNILRRSKSEK
jgi:glycosyltransferase involved in cell wall biosynthesis